MIWSKNSSSVVSLLVLSGTLVLRATPTRAVSIDERLLGSNKTHYAILRTEVDNMGSYYDRRTKQFLQVYRKTGV